jgi:hypothetical protein
MDIDALVPDPFPLRCIPTPPEVTRVEGCTCGGFTFHAAPDRGKPGCGLFSMPWEQAKAAIEAAQDREQAYTGKLNARLREQEKALREYRERVESVSGATRFAEWTDDGYPVFGYDRTKPERKP